MSSGRYIHEGFSDVAYEPVAQTFFGFRAFKIAERGVMPTDPARQTLVRVTADDTYADDGVPVLLGGLRGVFMSAYQWGDGPNVAMCLNGYPSARPDSMTTIGGKPHSLLMPDCHCGFWAYTNGQHVLSVSGQAALGIVEGWGRMVLGPDGFRAEKARIVALAFTDEAEAVLLDSAFSLGADRLNALLASVVGASTTFRNRIRSLVGLPDLPPPPPTPITRASRPWEHVDPVLRRAVMRAYPSARVFHSVHSMLAEFPMSDLTGLLPPVAPDTDEQEQAS